MRIHFSVSELGKIQWWELGIRFFFGGAITVLAGLLAKRFGPVFGGLFLAFPAIFPATATLIERHERERKEKVGILDDVRGRKAAALDARGTVLGTIGLVCFAIVVWKTLTRVNAGIVLAIATSTWLIVAVGVWKASRLRFGREGR
jgi:hypothetical protein